jgi:hypothetical protein
MSTDEPCADCGAVDEPRVEDRRDGKMRCWACLPEPCEPGCTCAACRTGDLFDGSHGPGVGLDHE